MRDTWRSFQISGWDSFVLKEKLKLMKVALRDWHQRHSKNLLARILSPKDNIVSLDLKGESTVLSDEEVQELHGLSEDLFSLSLQSKFEHMLATIESSMVKRRGCKL